MKFGALILVLLLSSVCAEDSTLQQLINKIRSLSPNPPFQRPYYLWPPGKHPGTQTKTFLSSDDEIIKGEEFVTRDKIENVIQKWDTVRPLPADVKNSLRSLVYTNSTVFSYFQYVDDSKIESIRQIIGGGKYNNTTGLYDIAIVRMTVSLKCIKQSYTASQCVYYCTFCVTEDRVCKPGGFHCCEYYGSNTFDQKLLLQKYLINLAYGRILNP